MRVVVLGGGRSSEHDVSLASAEAVRDGLQEAGHEVLDVRIDRDGAWRTRDEPIAVVPGRGLLGADAVFPALHGPFGEDGSVQGLLECLDVAYVGASVLGSAVCMDKLVFKELMAHAGLPQVRWVAAEESTWDRRAEAVLAEAAGLDAPWWVKPARLGSSVGIVRVAESDGLRAAIEGAFAHDPRVIIEASGAGLEVECSVLGDLDAVASRPGEIVLTGADWYDYEAKYVAGGMRLEVPARISRAAAERVAELAVVAFRRASCSGMARVDFFVDGEDVLLNELNTIPGFTSTSVYAKLFQASGVPYPELLDRLVVHARERHARERAHRY